MMGKIGAAMLLIGVGAVSLSGCGGGGHGGGLGGASCQPNVQFTWTLVDAANHVFQCEDVGATTVVVNMGGMTSSFNCNAYAGATATVLAGAYSTAFQLQDGSGNVLSQTPSMNVTVSGCGTIDVGQIDFEVTPPATACATQDVALTWSIVQNNTNGPALTCAQVGAASVRLNLGSNMFDFNCDAGAGRTIGVTEGTYATYLQLFGTAGQVLSMTDSMSITVPHCAGVTLPAVTFGVH